MSTWFITGASRGLGAAMAAHALSRGDNVVAAARHPQRVIDNLGEHPNLFAVPLDVTDAAQCADAVGEAVGRFDRIDVLVNNAGRGLIGAFEEFSEAETRAQFELNVFGVVHVSRAVLPTMRSQQSGTIVNISSTSGMSGGAASALYSANKFAVEGITEALREELAPFGIRAVVVAPGGFRTDFLDATSLWLPENPMPEYDGTTAHNIVEALATRNHHQTGDPNKLAALVWEMVQTDDLPVRLPVGPDAVATLERRIASDTNDLNRWRTLAEATDLETN